MIIYLVIGIVLIVIGIFLLMQRKRTQSHLIEIKSMQSLPLHEIMETQRSIADEIGLGGFNQLVETNGVVVCDEPVTAELSGEHCAYYEMRVEERYEEAYWEKDSEGRDVQRTRTGSQTVASNSQSGCFYVGDGQSRIRIDPDGAKLDLQKSVDRFEPADGGIAGAISFGSFALNLSSGMSGRRILGYHYSESILPLGKKLYVVGAAKDTAGELAIGKPTEKDKPFIVSLKSEEEITEGIEGKTRWLMIGAIASMVIGIGTIVAGIMTRK